MYHEMCWYCNILTVPFWFTTSHPRQLPCVFTSTTPQFHPILVARIPIWPPLPVPCCSIRSTDHATFFLSPPCCPPNQPLPALRNTEKQSALTVIVLQVTHKKTHTHKTNATQKLWRPQRSKPCTCDGWIGTQSCTTRYNQHASTNMHQQHNKAFTYPFSPRTICQSRNNACGRGCVFLSTWHPAHSTTAAATPVNHGHIETSIEYNID